MEITKVRDIDVTVVRKDIKNIHLRVYPPDGFVRVTVPQEMTDDAIRIFLIKKLSWIRSRQQEFRKVERLSPREFLQRESHYYLGQRYLLKVVDIEGNAKQRITVKNRTTLVAYLKSGLEPQKAQEIMDEFYRQELRPILDEYVQKWEQKLDVQVEDWKIMKMRTRWGSCNHEKRRVLLNLELAKKPHRCIEYIVVHELIHILEKTHNKHFVELMDMHLPNWRALKYELNNLPVSHAEWNY